jgi:hypothetical protein
MRALSSNASNEKQKQNTKQKTTNLITTDLDAFKFFYNFSLNNNTNID